MRGSLKQRAKGSWTIILDLGYKYDSETGKRKRNQKWFTVRGTKRDAEARLTELLHRANRNELVEPSKLTFGEWLDDWVQNRIKPNRRLRTFERYQSVIRRHLKPDLGFVRIQELGFAHLEAYYSKKSSSLSQTTLKLHHAVISSSLKWAHAKAADNPERGQAGRQQAQRSKG